MAPSQGRDPWRHELAVQTLYDGVVTVSPEPPGEIWNKCLPANRPPPIPVGGAGSIPAHVVKKVRAYVTLRSWGEEVEIDLVSARERSEERSTIVRGEVRDESDPH